MADIRIDISANDRATNDMRRLRNEVESIDDNTRRSTTSFQNLGNALTGLAAGAGIVAGIGATIWQMAEQGESIRDLGVQFETYLSALDRDANMLQRLRETTRGVVDDATLMRSAVDAYRLAGAETEDQILELINIGSTLGGGTAGVEALIGVLRNGSSAIEVLDTAGLSAGNVRARWQELKETMEDSDEAFRLAVLEEGRAQLARFGEGLELQASSIDTWSTRVTNAVNNMVAGVADGVEWFLDNAINPIADAANAGYLDEILTQLLTGESALEAIQNQIAAEGARSAIQGMAADFAALNTGLNQSLLFGGNTEIFFTKLTEAALEFEEAMGRAPQSVTELEDAMKSVNGAQFSFGNTDELAADFFIGFRYRMEQEANEALTSALTNLSMGGAAFGSLEGILGDGIFGNLAEIEQAERLIQSFEVTLARATEDRAAGLITANEFEMLSNLQPIVEGYRQQVVNVNAQMQMQAELARGINEGWRTATGYIRDALLVADQFIAGDTLLANIETQASTIASAFGELGAGEVGGITLFSDDAYNQITTLSQQIDSMVAQAEELNQIGVISDDELEAVRNTAAEMTVLANEAERGRDALREMSLSDILGTSDGGTLGELTDEIVGSARDAGVSEERIAELQRILDEQSGRVTETSAEFESRWLPLITATLDTNSAEAAATLAMDVLNQLATERAGMPVEWSEEGFSAVQENIAAPMQEARDATVEISENLATLTATPQRIVVELDVTAQPDALAAALAPFIARAVRDNGGTVPGENPRQGGGSTPR